MSEPTQVTNSQTEYRWYMAGHGLFFFAGGLQLVLAQWLIAFYLRESPAVVGTAQMIMMLPQLLFMAFGGMLADRTEIRRHMLRLQVLHIIPATTLALLIASGHITTAIVVTTFFMAATIGSLLQPARDALLNRVTERQGKRTIQQSVTIANGLQFGFQILGITLAAMVREIGPLPILTFQVFIYIFGAYTTTRLNVTPPEKEATNSGLSGLLHDLQDGFRITFQIDRVRPIVLWSFFMGLTTMGNFMVTLPLVVREIYNGDAPELALLNICFFLGAMVSSILLSRLGHIQYQGRVLIYSAFMTIAIVVLMSTGLTKWAFFAIIFVWGISSGVSLIMSRALVQEWASETHRARILSIFQLATFGASPIASFIAGQLVANLGALAALFVSAIATCFILANFLIFSNLWKLDSPDPEAVPESSEALP